MYNEADVSYASLHGQLRGSIIWGKRYSQFQVLKDGSDPIQLCIFTTDFTRGAGGWLCWEDWFPGAVPGPKPSATGVAIGDSAVNSVWKRFFEERLDWLDATWWTSCWEQQPLEVIIFLWADILRYEVLLLLRLMTFTKPMYLLIKDEPVAFNKEQFIYAFCFNPSHNDATMFSIVHLACNQSSYCIYNYIYIYTLLQSLIDSCSLKSFRLAPNIWWIMFLPTARPPGVTDSPSTASSAGRSFFGSGRLQKSPCD